MHKFNTPQKVYELGKVKVGGQPGETPTFLIGSIFWLGQKMVKDANQGIFDAEQAENLINKTDTLSDLTGVPLAYDIVGTTETAFEKYIDFVAKHSEAPLMLDAMSPRTRMKAAELAKNMGLQDRCLYNSVYKGVRDAELEVLKDSGIKMSIVLADNPKDQSLEGKMQILEEAIPIIKEKFGHPTGLGSGNVVTTMGWVKANFEKQFRYGTRTATNAIMQTMCANWLMFGPVEQSDYVFPAVAITDAYVASAMGDLGIRPLEETHPIYKIFL
jgi:tetrahydromethanopterin S-methyltransferase subunit H